MGSAPFFAAASIAATTSGLAEAAGAESDGACSCLSVAVAAGVGRAGVVEAFASSLFFGVAFGFGFGVLLGVGFGEVFGAGVGELRSFGAAVAVGISIALTSG